MSTYVATFSFVSKSAVITAVSFPPETLYFIDGATESGNVILAMQGASISLDGNPPITVASLPSGFTVINATMRPVTGAIQLNMIAFAQIEPVGGSATIDLNLSTFSTTVIGTLSPGTEFHTWALPGFETTDFLSNLIASLANVDAGGFSNLPLSMISSPIEIFGDYTIFAFTWTFGQDGDSVSPGDIITLTSVGPGSGGIDWTNVTLSVPCGVIVPITQTPTSISFAVPDACDGNGITTLTATGNGVQFTGPVALGTLVILLINGSGIYKLVTGQRHDEYYSNLRDGSTVSIKIPNPTAKTGFVGG